MRVGEGGESGGGEGTISHRKEDRSIASFIFIFSYLSLF